MGDLERRIWIEPTGHYALGRERMSVFEAEAAVERERRMAGDRPRTTPRVWLGRWLLRVGAALASEAEPARLQARRS